MDYVTYEYYKNEYKGNANEDDFNKYNFEAQLEYDNYTMKTQLTNKLLEQNQEGAKAIKLSICKMVDNFVAHQELLENAKQADLIASKGIASESVKDHSVTFSKSDLSKVDIINSQLEVENRKLMLRYLFKFGLVYRGIWLCTHIQ